eukprot:SAG11_NODE_3_length_39220_cov_67.005828_18_plen_402_part_00
MATASCKRTIYLKKRNRKTLEPFTLAESIVTYRQASIAIAAHKKMKLEELEISNPVTGTVLNLSDKTIPLHTTILYRRFFAGPRLAKTLAAPERPQVPLAHGGARPPPCAANHAPAYFDRNRKAARGATHLLDTSSAGEAGDARGNTGAGDITITDALQTLGLSAVGATMAEIRRAYHALARVHHPDKSAAPNAGDIFRTIQQAYDLLVARSQFVPRPVQQQPGPPGDDPTPEELLCPVCKSLMREAVALCCCYSSVCAACAPRPSAACGLCAVPANRVPPPVENAALRAVIAAIAAHSRENPVRSPPTDDAPSAPPEPQSRKAGGSVVGTRRGQRNGIAKRRPTAGAKHTSSMSDARWRCAYCYYHNRGWRPSCRQCSAPPQDYSYHIMAPQSGWQSLYY